MVAGSKAAPSSVSTKESPKIERLKTETAAKYFINIKLPFHAWRKTLY